MLDVRLARLGLPLPLEPAIGRALMHRDRGAQHEGLVLAWELAVRILAGSLWAVCRDVGATSPALDAVAAKLDRPSLGHWVELARTCATLLRERTEPAALAVRATLDGLQQPLPQDGGLRALSLRIAALPGDGATKPRRIQELLDQLPRYRNDAQSTHKDLGPTFREDSVPALLEGLIDFCERVPLLGNFSLVLVGRLERSAAGRSVELARLHGTFLTWAARDLPETTWQKLLSSRPYLFLEPDLVVPLFPMCAASASGSEWHVGWYSRQVHKPTVVYQSAGGQEFQLALAPDDLASLARGARRSIDDAATAEILRHEPYRGLLAYQEEHAAIFFGREEETEAAVARAEEHGALFVYGASGSGKSSWLRAGIVPALRARAALAGKTLRTITLVPGDRPLASLRRALMAARGGSPEDAARWARAVDEALANASATIGSTAASTTSSQSTTSSSSTSGATRDDDFALAHLLRGLAAGGERPVLLVDQLEEAALAAIDPAEGRAFLALVAGAARSAADVGAIVLASARADLLAPLIEHAGLRRFLQEDGLPIGSIPPERLTRVIVDPLHGRKVGVEPGLAETIVGDVGSEPGSLALLSQVLTTLWTERERFGGALTKQGYVDAGRVAGALEKQAETALSEARAGAAGAGNGPSAASGSAGSVSAASAIDKRVDRLFRALAQSDEGERFTRRRVKLADLASELATSEGELRTLSAPFVKRRLVVLSGDAENSQTAEVAHESLLVAWPRLRDLLASEREVLELRKEVEHASSAWSASGGGRSELWSDATSKLRRSEELLAASRLDLDQRGRKFLSASRSGVRRRKRVERAVLAVVAVLVVAAAWAAWVATRASEHARLVSRLSVALQRTNASLENGRKELVEARNRADREARVATQRANDVLSLSAVQDLKDLEAGADALWPAHPENLAGYESWLEDARELIEGRAGDAARGIKARPSLEQHQAKLLEFEAQALPQTEEQRVAERAAHPRAKEFAEARARLQWMKRMLGEDPWPSESEIEAQLAVEKLPTDADGLNKVAWPLVDPDKLVNGGEVRGLLLARRAVAAAPETQRHMYRDTLAWALFRTGRFEEALSEERRALAEAPETSKSEYAGQVKKLEEAVSGWRGGDGSLLATRREEAARIANEVAALEAEVNRRQTWSFADGEARWWHVQLSKLVADLEALRDPQTGLFSSGISEVPGWGIVRREEFARSIEERSVSGADASERWSEAIVAIASSPKYGGLQLKAQLGLLPISADPDSGLWEFAHLQTGDEAERGADGKLVLRDGMGLVFVLIPGGKFWMGAQKIDPAGQNYDPQEGSNEGPVHEVELSPYFLSKYEMTQGQWSRIAANNPSYYQPPGGLAPSLLHPVEQVSWTMCFELLERLGLSLPSEAQWECGARGGTSTPWWTGPERESLRGMVNIADQTAKKAGAPWSDINDWPDLEDGSVVHCAVGKYAANAFGLHEVHGNVWEWCLDGFDPGFYGKKAGKDPVSPWLGSAARPTRGCCFNNAASLARSAARNDSTPAYRGNSLGLRPSRALRLSSSPLHPPK